MQIACHLPTRNLNIIKIKLEIKNNNWMTHMQTGK